MSFWLDWAVHKPLKINFTPRNRSRTDGIILHVAASEAASLHGWFSNPKAAAVSSARLCSASVCSSAASERGVGWHALGVPASRSQKSAGVSQTGGELWSGAPGKVCPGAERVPQIPGIVELARGGLQEGEEELTSEQARQLQIAASAAGKLDYALDNIILPLLTTFNAARVGNENTLNAIREELKNANQLLGELAKNVGELIKHAA